MSVSKVLPWLAAALATPAISQTAPSAPPAAPAPAAKPGLDLASKLINIPGTNWKVYGPNQTAKLLDKEGPSGYPAMRVTVSKPGKNAWDVGAVSAVQKPVGAGDVILVALYLRAPELKDGETLELPLVGATGAAAPYPAIAGEKVTLTNQWKTYFAAGKAPQVFAAGGVQATVHLADAKHVIDLGPLRVFDFGPDFDPKRLPHN
jgi:hypothetical protein